MNFFEKCEIESAICEIERILADGKLQNPSVQCADKKADFTVLMINLRDLLSKTEKFPGRINSTDDVIPMWQGTGAEVLDVTSLVTCFRDAMCHPESFRQQIGPKVRLTFGTQIYGKFVARDFEDFKRPTCDYEDDFILSVGSKGFIISGIL